MEHFVAHFMPSVLGFVGYTDLARLFCRLFSAWYDKEVGCRSPLPGAFSVNCHMSNDLNVRVTYFRYDPWAMGRLIAGLAGVLVPVKMSLVTRG